MSRARARRDLVGRMVVGVMGLRQPEKTIYGGVALRHGVECCQTGRGQAHTRNGYRCHFGLL